MLALASHHHHHTCYRVLITCIIVTEILKTEQVTQPTPTQESASVEPGYLRQRLPLTCNGYHELHAELLDISAANILRPMAPPQHGQHTEP
jgi:hypothetical protein